MPTLDDDWLRPARDARIAAALDSDPALANELDLIGSQLAAPARARFLGALVEELERHARPAAAVLAALERAARDGAD